MIRKLLGIEARSLGPRDSWITGFDFGPRPTAAGQEVTDETALTLSPVWDAVRILTENVSTLPLDSIIAWDGAMKPYRPRPEWIDFAQHPFGPVDVLGQMMMSLLFDGNTYLATARDVAGFIQWVEVLDPKKVMPQKLDTERQVTYLVGSGRYTSREILHVPAMLRPGGIKGLSPIGYARETIALGLAAQEYGARFFGSGAIPGAILEAPGPVSEAGVTQLKAAWNEAHAGAGNAHRVAVLTEGAKFTHTALAPDEAQFIQTRQFTVAEVARVFGVPPHLLSESSHSTSWGSGIETQNTGFYLMGLRPWVTRIEQGFTRLLRSEPRSGGPMVKLDMDQFLRGSMKERLDGYSIGLQQGIYNLDEVRGLEKLPALPNGEGKLHRVPLNLKPTADDSNPALSLETVSAIVALANAGFDPDFIGKALALLP